MKRLFHLALAVAGLLAVNPARAWNYQDGDALLIFRESGFNDVEFDLGNINQFTNLTSGTTITVTNWNKSLVTNTFGTDLTGVSVIVASSTSYTNGNKAAWLSSSDTSIVPSAVTPSSWQSKLWSVINSVGTRPVIYLVPVTNGASAYSIDPSGSYSLASYDQIVTANGQNSGSLAQLGGNAAFTVEQEVPGTFNFWRIAPSSVSPKPDAVLVGSFTITAAGALTFTAGGASPAPVITSIVRTGSTNTITFSTVSGASYSLVYTNKLDVSLTNWPTIGSPVAGDGSAHSLTHTNAGSVGYYRIFRTP